MITCFQKTKHTDGKLKNKGNTYCYRETTSLKNTCRNVRGRSHVRELRDLNYLTNGRVLLSDMISHEGAGSYILISCRDGKKLNQKQRDNIEMVSKLADDFIHNRKKNRFYGR